MYEPLAATSCGGGGQSKVHKDFRTQAWYVRICGASALEGVLCDSGVLAAPIVTSMFYNLILEQPVLTGILTC